MLRRFPGPRLSPTIALALAAVLLAGCTVDAVHVQSGALTQDTTYLWLLSSREGETSVFSPQDEKAVLSVRFDLNYRASYEWYKVEWIAPDGDPYKVVSTRTEFGSHRDLQAELQIRGKRAAVLPGLWRVRLTQLGRDGEPDRELLSRLFRIEHMAPLMQARARIDAPAARDPRPLAGDLPPGVAAAALAHQPLGVADVGELPVPEAAGAEPSPAAGSLNSVPADEGAAATADGTPAVAAPAPRIRHDPGAGCPSLYYPPDEGCVEESPEE